MHSFSLTRRALLSGLSSALATPALAQRERPPRFETASRQFTQISPPRALKPMRLRARDGRMNDVPVVSGGVTLINFWATWCPGCVNELPTLERLHAANQGARVIAISVDREGGRERVERYLQKLSIRKLPVYLDPDGEVAYTDRENPRGAPFALYGMPITYLVDRQQRVVGYFPGEADWTSPDAARLLAYYRGA